MSLFVVIPLSPRLFGLCLFPFFFVVLVLEALVVWKCSRPSSACCGVSSCSHLGVPGWPGVVGSVVVVFVLIFLLPWGWGGGVRVLQSWVGSSIHSSSSLSIFFYRPCGCRSVYYYSLIFLFSAMALFLCGCTFCFKKFASIVSVFASQGRCFILFIQRLFRLDVFVLLLVVVPVSPRLFGLWLIFLVLFCCSCT